MRRRKMNRRFIWMLFLLTGMIFLWTFGVQAEGENGLHYEDADRYKIYYLEYGARLRSEWKTVNGAQYYFGADGYAYRSGIEQIGTARYAFREDGTLITSGWAEYGGIRVYIQNRMMVKGDRMIGGKWYFFDRESGAMRTGLVRTGTGYKLYGQNGIWIGDVSSSGWNEVGGDRYYIENGETLKGIRTIGQETYSFDSEGQMERDVIREDSGNRKLFGKDGKMLHGGWYQLDGNWYYIDPGTGTILSGGLYTINGKRYLLDEEGVMQKNNGTDGTTVYTIGADGAVTAAKRLSDGWTLSGGEYYYYRNGKPFTGWKGNYYVSNGKMLRNTVAPGGYYVDEGGKAKVTAGWEKIEETSGSRWVYAKKGGKLMKNSWLKIGNSWYYLGGDDGYTMLTGARKIGKKWYIFSAGGVLKKELGKALPTGWVKAGPDWYFFRNGKVLTGRYTIGGKIYSLKQSLLISGGFTDLEEGRSYYSRSDGAAQNYTGWKEYTYDLKAYEGKQVKFAIRYISHYNSYGSFMLMVDNVFVGMNAKASAIPNEQFQIYLDGELVTTTTDCSYVLEGIANGNHTIGIKATYLKAQSETTTIEANIPSDAYSHVILNVTANSKLTANGQHLTLTNTATMESYSLTDQHGGRCIPGTAETRDHQC